jgi:hypothetical protein
LGSGRINWWESHSGGAKYHLWGRVPRPEGLRLHWPQGVDPVDGLTALEQGVADVRVVEAERRRLLDPVVPPAGWSYMLAAGPGDVYRHAVAEGRPAIEVVCDDDAGVIEKDIDVALRSDTTIEWSWRVEALPGVVPEITPWTHRIPDAHHNTQRRSGPGLPGSVERDRSDCPPRRDRGRSHVGRALRRPAGRRQWHGCAGRADRRGAATVP